MSKKQKPSKDDKSINSIFSPKYNSSQGETMFEAENKIENAEFLFTS